MPGSEHEEVKRYALELLRHYGIPARSEVPVGGRRVDVAGLHEGRWICVEVSKSSDLAKDVDSLSGCDLKLVVWLKPYQKIRRVDDVWVVRPEELEDLLRSLLGVSIGHTRCPQPSPSRSEGERGDVRSPEDVLKSFERRLTEWGLAKLREPAERLLLKIHALGEVAVERWWMRSPSEPMTVSAYEDPKVVNLLKQLGLITERGEGTYYDGKEFLASLTEEGRRLASAVAWREVKGAEELVEDAVRRHGPVVAFVASYNRCLWARDGDLRSAVEGLEVIEVFGEIIILGCGGHAAPERKAAEPLPLRLFLEWAVSLPRLRERCLAFVREFERVHLAFLGRERGREKACMVPELAERVAERVRDEALKRLGNVVREFGVLSALYNLASRAFRRVREDGSFKERLMRALGADEAGLRALARELNARGLTSELVGEPPFLIVLDWDGLLEALGERAASLEGRLLA